jgi:hypothetical protein
MTPGGYRNHDGEAWPPLQFCRRPGKSLKRLAQDYTLEFGQLRNWRRKTAIKNIRPFTVYHTISKQNFALNICRKQNFALDIYWENMLKLHVPFNLLPVHHGVLFCYPRKDIQGISDSKLICQIL